MFSETINKRNEEIWSENSVPGGQRDLFLNRYFNYHLLLFVVIYR